MDDDRFDCLWPKCDCLDDCDPDAVDERIEQREAAARAALAGGNGQTVSRPNNEGQS